MKASPGTEPLQGELPAAIADLAQLVASAKLATDAGEMVELDIIAMRIAVLSDAVSSLDPVVAKPLQPALEALMSELDSLDFALRRRNVDVSLDLAQADRRLRAQAAYGGKADKK